MFYLERILIKKNISRSLKPVDIIPGYILRSIKVAPNKNMPQCPHKFRLESKIFTEEI